MHFPALIVTTRAVARQEPAGRLSPVCAASGAALEPADPTPVPDEGARAAGGIRPRSGDSLDGELCVQELPARQRHAAPAAIRVEFVAEAART